MPKLYLGEKLIYGESLAELASVAGEFGYGVVADGAGGVYSVPLFGGEAVFGEVKLTGEAAGDNFGSSVAVGSSRIVIGAQGDDSFSGSAYIYDLNGNPVVNSTSGTNKLLGEASGDNFGYSVAVGDDRILVGAPFESTSGTNGGAAYIYDLNGNLINKLVSENSEDRFGFSVATGSNRVVVGAVTADSDTGAAYVYDLDGTQLFKLSSENVSFGDNFGRVAVGSNRIVVGAPYESTVGSRSGASYIYDLLGNEIIKLFGEASQDYFGEGVSVNSGRIIIAANRTNNLVGSVYIYDMNGNQINKLNGENEGETNFFGASCSLGSGKILIGASGVSSFSGAAYIYDFDGNNIFKLSGKNTSDLFGISVAVGSGRIVVGAYGDDDNGSDSGSAYIYQTPIFEN